MSEEVLRAAAAMLASAGLGVADLEPYLVSGPVPADAGAPTVSVFLSELRRSLGEGTLRGYETHFRRFESGIARQCDCTCDACLAEFASAGTCTCACRSCRRSALDWAPAGERVLRNRAFTRTELEPFAELAQRMSAKKAHNDNRARARRGLSAKPDHGQGGREMAVAALRCLFGRAVDDEVVERNPAEKLDKGDRGRPRRTALSDAQLDELLAVVVGGGNDPELDLLISWVELELGARRGGVAGLKMGALFPGRQTVELVEKGDKRREQPCSAELIDHLLAHAAHRGGTSCVTGHPDFDPNAPVLYQLTSTPTSPRPLGRRRFDTLHRRVQQSLPWANEMMYSGHALRHTLGTVAERLAGTQVARDLLGHAGGDTTSQYTGSGLPERAAVVSVITGRPHPLAAPPE